MERQKLIPDRWTQYKPVGKRIPGTRFIAFKVPLKSMYDDHLATCNRFSPKDLVKNVEKQNEELGLIVDLTFTNRYYSPEDLPKTIQYKKIFTIGHEVPNNGVIAEFKSIVTRYLHQNSKNDKLVGVHCTHGLNRTGYLVCRYMIDVLSMEPSKAIKKFNKSRGHNIERSNYLQDLLQGESRSNPELKEPCANYQQRFSSNNANSRPPPCPEEQPRSHRAPNGPKHHPQRPFPHYRGYDTMNGAPPQDCRPRFPHQSNDTPGNSYPVQPPRSQQRDNYNPYQRFPNSGRKKRSKKPRQ